MIGRVVRGAGQGREKFFLEGNNILFPRIELKHKIVMIFFGEKEIISNFLFGAMKDKSTNDEI